MLIQKPFTTNDVVTIKLTNGDEIVGKFVKQDQHNNYTIRQPVIVMIQPTGPQSVGLSFMPFTVSTDDDAEVTLPITAMLTKPMMTKDDIANNYRRATGSLEVAKPGLILPR